MGSKRSTSLNEMVSSIKQTIASGELSAQQKAELEDSLRKIGSMSEEERDSLDYFLHHIPENDSDLTLIVLKGHLLIEQRIREFISERMLSPAALDDARLSSYQAICLAEALTLPNAEPKQLWDILRQLNTLRNQMAHNLDPQGVEQRIQKVINDYSQISPVESGFVGVLGHAYGQLSELCRLARDPSFRVRGRNQ
jgi:hypothetical protein